MLGSDSHASANAHDRDAHFRRRRRARAWAIVALVAIGISLAVWLDVRSRYDFFMTQFNERGDSALPYSIRLRETTVGIRLALDDIDCFGGSNRGWSSWVLHTSPRQEVVLPGLREIAANDPREARRIEALELLWNLTGESEYARDLFRIAQAAGPPRIAHARATLQSMVDDEVVRAGLLVPDSQPIGISEDRFFAALKKLPTGSSQPHSPPETP